MVGVAKSMVSSAHILYLLREREREKIDIGIRFTRSLFIHVAPAVAVFLSEMPTLPLPTPIWLKLQRHPSHVAHKCSCVCHSAPNVRRNIQNTRGTPLPTRLIPVGLGLKYSCAFFSPDIPQSWLDKIS